MPSEAALEQPNMFLNLYTCYRCGEHWTDVWECQVDDDCPHCGARHCSPVESETLIVADHTSQAESRRSESSEPNSVLVIVSGGVVQDVVCPDGITVVVHDFDVEGVEDDVVVTQRDERYVESVWSAD